MAAAAPTLPSTAQLYQQQEQNVQGWGNAQQQSLYQNYLNAMGQGMQSLASSGLAGTTVGASMREGFMKQYQLALNNLGGQLQQQFQNVGQTFGLGGIQANQAQQQIGIQQQQANTQAGYLGLSQNQQAFQQQAYQQAQTPQVGYGMYTGESSFVNSLT